MRSVRTGDVFRDLHTKGCWRVAGERNGVFELVSINKPQLSRFQVPDKLLDPHSYAPVVGPDLVPNIPVPSNAAARASVMAIRRVLIVDDGDRLAARFGRALAAELEAQTGAVICVPLADSGRSSSPTNSTRQDAAVAVARERLGLGPTEPVFVEEGSLAEAVVRACEAWPADLIVASGRNDQHLIRAMLGGRRPLILVPG